MQFRAPRGPRFKSGRLHNEGSNMAKGKAAKRRRREALLELNRKSLSVRAWRGGAPGLGKRA